MKCKHCPCPFEQHHTTDRRACTNCSCPMFVKWVPTWDDYFFGICDAVKQRCKDESTELGAVIIDQRKRIVATGYNSFPSGINDVPAERQQRPLKYQFMEHAERNAIYNAVASMVGCSIYCAWLPCPDCARAIINVGITTIVVKTITLPERWKENMRNGAVMLCEAGVSVRLPNAKKPVEHIDIMESLK